MNQFIQLLVLAIAAVSVLHRIPGKSAVRIVALIFAVYFALQVASLYTLDSFINYPFYNHLDPGDLRVYLFQFLPQVGLLFVLIVLAWFVFVRVSNWVRQALRPHFAVSVLVLAGAVAIMCLPAGVLRESYGIYRILSVNAKAFEEALTDLGIDPGQYPGPGEIHATAGKNIVVISMESVERGFLGQRFPGLTPNLRRMSEELTYSDMPLVPGTGWTAGSMYGYQVGMPAFFKGQGNDFFQGVEKVRLTGLGHVLNAAGYYTRYIIGKPEFAGAGDLLGAYEIQVVSELNSIGRYPETKAGLNDLDLFEEAKLHIREAVAGERPFAIFMSTINSHYPDGIHDSRMEDRIGTERQGLEFSVAALDYLVGDFMEFLSVEGLIDDTVVFLFPDHLLMGRAGDALEKLGQDERSLFLITNAGEDKLGRDAGRPVHLIEMPRLVLEGAGIDSNARFLADFVGERPLVKFVSSNALKLTALNQASIYRTDFAGGFTVELRDDRLLIAAQKNSDSVGFEIKGSNDKLAYNVVFNGQMNFVEKAVTQVGDFFRGGQYDDRYVRVHLAIQLQDDRLVAYLGDKKNTGIARSGEGQVEFSAGDIATVLGSADSLAEIYRYDPAASLEGTQHAANIIRVTSSAWGRSGSLKMGEESYPTRPGLNLFLFEKGRWGVETYDTWWSESAANDFAAKVRALREEGEFFVIAVNNAVRNSYSGYGGKLRRAGLGKLAALHGRTAYLAFPDESGAIREYVSETTLSHVIAVPAGKGRAVVKEHAPMTHVPDHATDPDRFIAHAGGSIENKRYTNSLEALDHNYRKGFRLFELDIIETSDHHYVAAHDWGHWQRITGYEGPVPPTREAFKSRELHGRFSPLAMQDINSWFADHPEAVLVTDKVNDPGRFADLFVDRSRLIMELFSIDAVDEGAAAAIRSPMASWNVVMALGEDRVQKLRGMGVVDVAASRRTVEKYPEILKSLKESGIRVFAFHINADPGKDEAHTVCTEMDYFYGLYADVWDFGAVPECTD